jgi:hypothetical protein
LLFLISLFLGVEPIMLYLLLAKKKNAILTEHIDTSMNGQFVEVHIGWRLTILGVAHVHTYRKVKQR